MYKKEVVEYPIITITLSPHDNNFKLQTNELSINFQDSLKSTSAEVDDVPESKDDTGPLDESLVAALHSVLEKDLG